MHNLFALLCLLVLCQCTHPVQTVAQPKAVAYPFAKGADVSWITELEDSGRAFYNAAGRRQDLFAILKAQGLTAIRLRVWVHPANRYHQVADVLAKARRAKAAGMQLMIDFHYSDTWADPGHQDKPAAWAALPLAGLKAALYNHTYHVLDTLKRAGIVPDWVQVGNETRNGMLWPDGRATDHMDAYAALLDTGYAAVKAVDAGIKVIVHVDNGFDNALFRWHYDGITANHTRYDIIGMSLYPDKSANWQSYVDRCLANAKDMIARYGKPVMLVEIGMPTADEDAAKAFISALIAGISTIPGGKGLGVLYWEPQAYHWRNYDKVAWRNDGRPSAAMEGFK